MKCGTISFVGRPNVGKSSLTNAILNYSLAITTDKPQTTRNVIRGIYTFDDTQIIISDTPGIHKPKAKLGEKLNDWSYETINQVDLPIFLIPADEKLGPGDKFIIERIKHKDIAVITKNDLKVDITETVAELKELGFTTILSTSIKHTSSINFLVKEISELMPEGPFLYPEDNITDISMRFMAKEFVRESIINRTKDEVPHSVAVVVDEFIESEEKYEIHASIFVERDSQKGILVGIGGNMIKAIGQEARMKMKQAFGINTSLFLRVKVKKNWTNNPGSLINLGY